MLDKLGVAKVKDARQHFEDSFLGSSLEPHHPHGLLGFIELFLVVDAVDFSTSRLVEVKVVL